MSQLACLLKHPSSGMKSLVEEALAVGRPAVARHLLRVLLRLEAVVEGELLASADVGLGVKDHVALAVEVHVLSIWTHRRERGGGMRVVRGWRERKETVWEIQRGSLWAEMREERDEMGSLGEELGKVAVCVLFPPSLNTPGPLLPSRTLTLVYSDGWQQWLVKRLIEPMVVASSTAASFSRNR
jgi:hypothetical protein